MDGASSHRHPVLATGIPVAIVVILHVAISTAIIAAVDPDVPDLVVYWLVSVLGPAALWALLVIGRAAVWRHPSAFWLGASAGIVVLVSFLAAFLIYVDVFSGRGLPLALIYSSWILVGCAALVSLVLRAMGKHQDAPIDADEHPAPAPAPRDMSPPDA